jgi:S-adenosylmethionine:tRNA ribosyltransferase-isomerase
MKLSDFDFNLPSELIAQTPLIKRDESALLVMKPDANTIKTKFYDIVDYLKEGDLIVFNNSRVIKARLILKKNGKEIDFYLNKKLNENSWNGFARPAKKLKEGDVFNFGVHTIRISKKLFMGETEIEFKLDNISIFEFLDIYGQMPLPPYIKRPKINSTDDESYQTIYNDPCGSVASPTAGLHFTEELLNKIKNKNIEIIFVTLHVSAGTFLPVKTENLDDHKMHSEYCCVNEEAANKINLAKKEGRNIIAVGTTSLRTLESAAYEGYVKPGEFETQIFIKPGFEFQIVDMLITNFHLPKSTLLMLVCAFAGYNEILRLYDYAIKEKMRFFSYGDATLLYRIIPK